MLYNSGLQSLVRIVEVSVIRGVHFRRFHCIPYVKPLVPCVQKKGFLFDPFSSFMINHELALPLSAFPMGDVSGKV